MIDIQQMSASAEFKKLSDKKENYLSRAKEASKLTIPQLYPDSEETASTTYPTPYQSLGARGVNNLANKIVLSLFPPATAFFKLDANQAAKEGAGISDGQMSTAMKIVEKALVDEMEVSQLRSKLVDITKQGIVGGSTILYVPEEGQPKVFGLRQIAVKRSKAGKVLKMVLKEQVSFPELPEDIRSSIQNIEESELQGKKEIDLYTLIVLDEQGMYQVVQEVKSVKLAGTEGTYKSDELPYLFVPFVDRGEDYGRSFIEDYIGDLQSYEGLTKAILEAAAESARVIYLLRPNAVLTANKLAQAASGDVILGTPDDVKALQVDKTLDMQFAQAKSEELRRDLSTIFLLDSAVQRDAERVTAEEIRRVSQELETALGGVYATQANTIQEPLVRLYLKRLVKRGFIKDILKNNLDLSITTGSAALGRGTEFNAIQQYLVMAQQLLGEQFSTYINVEEALQRAGYSLDVNTAGLVKTQEQLQAEQAQAQQEQLEQNAVAPAINAASQQSQQEG